MESTLNSPEATAYREILESTLPAKKVRHCLSVARLMLSFGPGLGLEKAALAAAALLHDIARKESPEQLLALAHEYGIAVTPVEAARPNLLHGPVAAERCKRTLGITRPDVYEAIYWHTTARPGLCRLGQALYFADFSEPLRDYPEAGHARELLGQKGFEPALHYVARKKVEFLRGKSVVAPVSEDFLAWLDKGRPPCPG